MTRPKNQNLHLLTSQIVIIEAEFIRREKLKKIQLMGNLLFFLCEQLDLYSPFFVDKYSFDEFAPLKKSTIIRQVAEVRTLWSTDENLTLIG